MLSGSIWSADFILMRSDSLSHYYLKSGLSTHKLIKKQIQILIHKLAGIRVVVLVDYSQRFQHISAESWVKNSTCDKVKIASEIIVISPATIVFVENKY